MRRLILSLLAASACSSAPRSNPAPPLPKRVLEQEQGLAVPRDTERFTSTKPIPRPTDAERRDFQRLWEHFRKRDPRWPLERDRFKRRSDAAGYLVAAHLLRYYVQVNLVRARAGKELVRIKDEIVAVGKPCAPYLVDLMVLDRIPTPGGRSFRVDDLTRQDCLDMLERMGSDATPDLLRAERRPDLGPKGRRYAALALGGTRDRRAYPVLVKLLLRDPSWQVRADAAEALAKLGDRRAVGPLAQAVHKDPDPTVVKRAGKARYQLQGGRR